MIGAGSSEVRLIRIETGLASRYEADLVMTCLESRQERNEGEFGYSYNGLEAEIDRKPARFLKVSLDLRNIDYRRSQAGPLQSTGFL